MGNPSLKCSQPASKAVYDYLTLHRFSKPLDTGFRVIDYQHLSSPVGISVGAQDGEISCEELWEQGFEVLDTMGALADWEEDPLASENDDQKKMIERYQELRALIECKMNRPTPWVFEAPYLCNHSILGETAIPRDQEKLRDAKAIRTKVKGAVKKLNALLAEEKLKPVQRQQCLITFLYWFALVGRDVSQEPLDPDKEGKTSQLESFLVKQGVGLDVIRKIKEKFREYLRGDGGLGLVSIRSDAQQEATALESVTQKMGACTEQSKVMYAILRMAGMEAFFVEPQLSVEYFMAKNKPQGIPLQGHVASGVGVKILDENGKEKIWIVDVALKLLEADYIEEKPSQWNAHPYWELSLRHFYMADLSNLGTDQTEHGKYAGAEQSFKMALDLGEDSTAFHAMGNSVWLLRKKAARLSSRSNDYKKIVEQMDAYSKKAVELNPYNARFQANRGEFLLFEHDFAPAIEAFLQSIDDDPRFILPYQKLGNAIYATHEKTSNLFSSVWENIKKQMHEIVTKHSKLKRVVKKGLEEMQKSIPTNKQSGKELIDLIEQLKRDLNLWLG